MRLFSALLPPPRVAAALDDALLALRALPGAGLLRWSDPAGWHITLTFYGETDPDALPELLANLAGVARERAPFTLRLAGGGTFGDRALWAGVGGDTEGLVALAGATARAGTPGGRRHDGYRPHLTLARGDREGRPVLGPFAEALAGFAAPPWSVTALALMRSDDQQVYTTQGLWPLGGVR